MGLNRPKTMNVPPGQYSLQSRFGARAATGHMGSKRWFPHRGHTTRQQQLDFRHAQLADAGQLGLLKSGQKCVPPGIKLRRPLEPAHPVSSGERLLKYAVQNGHGEHMLPGADHGRAIAGLTPAQRRRRDKKLGHAQARGIKDVPEAVQAAPEPVPAAPLPLRWSQRAARALRLR